MKSRFRRVALVGKYQTQGSGALLERVARFIAETGSEVFVEAASAAGAPVHGFPTVELAEIGRQCDLVVVVGGDGTMLSTARTVAGSGVPLVGINQGRLGFITDIALDAYEIALPRILAGQYLEDRRGLIFGRVIRDGHEIFSALALNDVVLSRGSTAGMIEVRVDVDGTFVVNQRADGVIVSSPTGSTAYALSAGGPILYPNIGGWVLVPIASHTLSNRPIVLPDTGTLTLEVIAGREASVNFDTQALASLRTGDRVLLRRSRESVCFLHPPGWSFFETLRLKLHWNEGIGAPR